MDFTGSSAVVIGCTGQTETMCRLLLAGGAEHVGIISGDTENLCAIEGRLADSRVLSLHANLGHSEQVHEALDLFRARAGRLDVVVNCAGLFAV
jgi:NAD(P)-dependent dehydrogenase (short-subunit alcohol dehydrogenase family)